MIQHRTGRILVESHRFGDGKPGIRIQIHCERGKFREMGFIVDHIENLLKIWYPGRSHVYIENPLREKQKIGWKGRHKIKKEKTRKKKKKTRKTELKGILGSRFRYHVKSYTT